MIPIFLAKAAVQKMENDATMNVVKLYNII